MPVFLQIAEGLEAAYKKGVIHRDLKPANIKVTDDGQVKISAGSGSEPLWSPDGSGIFYRAGDRLMAAPVRIEPVFEAGSPQELFTGVGVYASGRDRNYEIHPDGQRFLMIKPVETR